MDAWLDVSVDVHACRRVRASTRWHVGGLMLNAMLMNIGL